MCLGPTGDPNVFDNMPAVYLLSENTLIGNNGVLYADASYREGRELFVLDLMLHEMVHHRVMKEFGENDWEISQESLPENERLQREAWDKHNFISTDHDWYRLRRQHSEIFAQHCNRVCDRLELPHVHYFHKDVEHKKNSQISCIWFISNVRGKVLDETGIDYYQGAVLNRDVVQETLTILGQRRRCSTRCPQSVPTF